MLPYVEGARNCIRFANVQEREEVLILAEPDAELAAIEVISLCCRENEANVLVLYKEKTEFGREISPVIAEAIKAADTIWTTGPRLLWFDRMLNFSPLRQRNSRWTSGTPWVD
jgi:hypothetical protein